MVYDTFAFLETSLILSNYIIVLQEPCETMINHACAKTTCQSNWPVIIRMRSVFSEFRDRDYCCFLPSIWEILRLPQIIRLIHQANVSESGK